MSHVQALVWQEEFWWVAQCLDFDVASQGNSEEEAKSNLKEALTLAWQNPISLSLKTSKFERSQEIEGKLVELELEPF